jgi:hypothetical protein
VVERRYKDGETIFRTGEAADGVYRVRSGCVRLDRAGGASRITLRAGEIFGESGFLTGAERDWSAVAVGDVTVDFLRRNEFLALLTDSPELIAPLFGSVFARIEEAVTAAGAPDPAAYAPSGNGSDAADDPAEGAAASSGLPIGRVRMIPDGKRVRSILGRDEIVVDRFPFSIGRTPDGEGKTTYTDVSLSIDDRRPYNLSRRHFAIDEDRGALIVRDFGSYHGTTVNGLALGGEGKPKTAPLRTGESSLVAGKPDSPFRFRIIVE